MYAKFQLHNIYCMIHVYSYASALSNKAKMKVEAVKK